MTDNISGNLYKLPDFIQKGNKRCNLSITKSNDRFIVKYSNND